MSGQVLIPLRAMVVLSTFLAGVGLPAAAAAQPRAGEAYGRLPLHFEANGGQAHPDVRFLSRGPGYGLYLSHAGQAVLVLTHATPAVLRMSLAGAAPKAPVNGLEELPGKANYFIGNDPAKWRTNLPTYAKVQYREVYPGIDLVYYGNQRQLEYDFVVAPGADPQKIALDFKGVERLEIDAQGDLVMHVAGAALRQHKPVIYQEIDGMRRGIAGGYVMKGAHQVAFQVAAYDNTRPLVIDPVLSYSTYLGGSALEEGWGIAVDTSGNAYVTGNTESANFPTSAGALDTTLGGSSDIFVTKLNATGTALVYSTYLGGSATEGGAIGIAVDSAGNAYVTGGTTSADFPTTPGAFQTTLPGGGDAFVTKLNAAGSALIYSTYLGGSGHEGGVFRIAVDTLGNAYVVGHTDSTDFPTTPGAFQTSFAGVGAAYVSKLNAAGSALVYSTYLGESSILIGGVFKELISIAVDTAGNAYVAGGTTSNTFPTTALAFQPLFGGGLRDAFVTKLDATGSALVYSTYLGGSVDDQAWGIAVDTAGNAYVTGFTGSNDFPVSAAAFDTVLDGNIDAFVTKLNATGSALVYSTYLGGSLDDGGAGIAVNSLGEAYVTGSTTSMNFPVTAGAPQSAFGGGLTDTFITKLNASGAALVYSTYLGGTSNDDATGIALDATGNAYAVGTTSSANFPITPGAFQTSFSGVADAFVVKLAEAVVPPPPAQTAGKVTGGGSINVAGGIGTFGFNVKRDAAGAPIDGNLQYVNHASGANVHSATFTTFAVTGNTASFGGTCTDNGAPCTFTVNAADNGEPGRNDSFEITVNAGPAEGGKLRGGNVQVHKQKP